MKIFILLSIIAIAYAYPGANEQKPVEKEEVITKASSDAEGLEPAESGWYGGYRGNNGWGNGYGGYNNGWGSGYNGYTNGWRSGYSGYGNGWGSAYSGYGGGYGNGWSRGNSGYGGHGSYRRSYGWW